MGLFYRVMIEEIREEFNFQEELDLESFLLTKEQEYQDKYRLSKLLLFLNYTEILKEEKSNSRIIKEKFNQLMLESQLNS